MTPLSIGFFCNSASWGGLEINTYKLAMWLAERGHTLTILTPPQGQLYQKASQHPSLTVIALGTQKTYGNLKTARQLARHAQQQRISHMVVSTSNSINLASIAKTLAGGRFKVSYLQQMMMGSNKKDLLHRAIYSQVDAWLVPIGAVGRNAKHYAGIPAHKIFYVPLAIDTEKFNNAVAEKSAARQALNLPPNQTLIGCIGRIDQQKGQNYIVEALAMLKTKYPNTGLVLVGAETYGQKGRFLPGLKALIEQKGLSDRVYFRPHTENLRPAYGCLDLFVMASWAETFGMVTIEAMAAGVPVIGSNAGGTVDLVPHQNRGLLFETRNAKALSQALDYALSHPEQMASYAAEAHKFVFNNFDKKAECDAFERMLAAIHGNRI